MPIGAQREASPPHTDRTSIFSDSHERLTFTSFPPLQF